MTIQNTLEVRNGDIIIVPFPFSNLERQKVRPALVISPKEYNDAHNELLVMQITSQKSSSRPEYFLQDWVSYCLKNPSYVRYATIFHLQLSRVLKVIGHISCDDYRNIIALLNKFLSEER